MITLRHTIICLFRLLLLSYIAAVTIISYVIYHFFIQHHCTLPLLRH